MDGEEGTAGADAAPSHLENASPILSSFLDPSVLASEHAAPIL